jgi:hypothetical protein
MTKALLKSALSFLLGASVLLGGCSFIGVDREAKIRKYSRISEINRRMLADDFEGTLMLDRPSSLSRWHIRTE